MGRIFRLTLLGCAAVAWSGQAAAYTMNFDFEETFGARVTADQAEVNGKAPYEDPKAKGLSGDDFQVSLKGSFETTAIVDITGGQTVLAAVTSFKSNEFGTVLLGAAAPRYYDPKHEDTYLNVNLTKLANGNFTIAAQALDSSVVKLTKITTKSTAFMGTKVANKLSQFGQYALYDESLSNLYGTRAYFDPGIADRSGDAFYDYIEDGADVANGSTLAFGSLDGGTLTLSSPDFVPPDPIGPTPPPSAVPEAPAWAMMVGGFALLGAVMRRRKPGVAVG